MTDSPNRDDGAGAAQAASAEAAGGTRPQSAPRMALAVICGVILIVMMALTVIDVIGRYGFNAPLIGATELTELLLVSVVFIGLPAVSMDDGHVSVDLFVSKMPVWIQPFRRIFVALVSSGVLAMVAWRLWVQGDQISGYGGVTNSLRLPVAPVAWFAAFCTAAAMLVTLWQVWREIRALRPQTT
ncbi:TRAP transporter small permease [Pseudooceanicola atlanticus]|uniref:TRAP transporter small permease n=1 Tax=Pseudooceanicola atlanticus TaxID=1461694 RepID=UPI000A44F6D5|nr:TRAP transporter small permease [Pseudooceanicola atlanticus]